MLETEIRESKLKDIELWRNKSILSEMLNKQETAFHAVKSELKSIEFAVSLAVKRLKKNDSKLIYVGAGTSGRIGVLDGIELVPTFGWPENRLGFCFSGINIGKTSEGSEDDINLAINHFEEEKITKNDVVLCLAASGSTIYTNTILNESKKIGALTVAFSNNKKSDLLTNSDASIFLNTGSEFLAGSTRLSAGTSQKIALNLFSTCLMVRLNKVYKGYMVDMIATNKKLRERAEKILVDITSCEVEKARQVLQKNNYNIKLSIMIINEFSKNRALQILEQTEGNLHEALKL